MITRFRRQVKARVKRLNSFLLTMAKTKIGSIARHKVDKQVSIHPVKTFYHNTAQTHPRRHPLPHPHTLSNTPLTHPYTHTPTPPLIHPVHQVPSEIEKARAKLAGPEKKNAKLGGIGLPLARPSGLAKGGHPKARQESQKWDMSVRFKEMRSAPSAPSVSKMSFSRGAFLLFFLLPPPLFSTPLSSLHSPLTLHSPILTTNKPLPPLSPPLS